MISSAPAFKKLPYFWSSWISLKLNLVIRLFGISISLRDILQAAFIRKKFQDAFRFFQLLKNDKRSAIETKFGNDIKISMMAYSFQNQLRVEDVINCPGTSRSLEPVVSTPPCVHTHLGRPLWLPARRRPRLVVMGRLGHCSLGDWWPSKALSSQSCAVRVLSTSWIGIVPLRYESVNISAHICRVGTFKERTGCSLISAIRLWWMLLGYGCGVRSFEGEL